MPKMIPRPPRDDLEDCRKERMTLDEIAEIYEVSVPTVKRWIRNYGLTSTRKPKKVLVMPQSKTGFQGSLLDQAKAKLGRRVSEHRVRGYFLDGCAVKADDLIVAAGLSPRQKV